MNIDTAKENMIQQQIRPLGITDKNLLTAVDEIPKEVFSPKAMAALAYSEIEAPASHCQSPLSTFSITKILQFLSIKKDQRVLQIGCDNGYLTALLAKLSLSVELCDIDEDIIHQTKHCLKSLGIYNVKYRHSNAWTEMISDQSCEVIIIVPGCDRRPEIYLKQLAVAGHLLYFIKHQGYTKAIVLEKTKKDHWDRTEIADFYNNILSKPQQFIF